MIYFTGNTLFSSEKIKYCDSETILNKIAALENNSYLSYDIETNSLSPYLGKILLVSFGNKENQFVFRGDYHNKINQVFNLLKEKNITLVAHNAKFDWQWTLHYYKTDLNIVCTMLAYKLLYCGLDDEASLDHIYAKFYKKIMDKSIRANFQSKSSYTFTESEILYAAKDVEVLDELYVNFLKLLEKNEQLEVNNLEQQCLKVYGKMELNGIYLDKEYWQKEVIEYYSSMETMLLNKMDDCLIKVNSKYENKNKSQNMFTGEIEYFEVSKKKVKPASKCLLNWDSVKQLKEMFKTVFNIDLEEDKLKDISTTGMAALIRYCNEEFVEVKDKSIEDQLKIALSLENPIIECLYVKKQITKLMSYLGESLLKEINPVTERIHTNVLQLGADTGRVSQYKPNLQNIKAENRLRNGFKAQKEGWMILTFDYSGAELRIIADGSGDPTMIEAFKNNEDVHSKMGSIMFKTEVSKTVNKGLRNKTKTIVFGLAYGAGPYKFAPSFDNSIDKAKQAVKSFFSSFPKIEKFLDRLGKQAMNQWYSTTFRPFNRIRWYEKVSNSLPDKERKEKLSAIERMGKNHPIQGTCADIVKYATLQIHNYIENNKLEAIIVNQVHDEIVIEFNSKTINPENFKKTIRNIMVEAGAYVIKSVPMEVESALSLTWQK